MPLIRSWSCLPFWEAHLIKLWHKFHAKQWESWVIKWIQIKDTPNSVLTEGSSTLSSWEPGSWSAVLQKKGRVNQGQGTKWQTALSPWKDEKQKATALWSCAESLSLFCALSPLQYLFDYFCLTTNQKFILLKYGVRSSLRLRISAKTQRHPDMSSVLEAQRLPPANYQQCAL